MVCKKYLSLSEQEQREFIGKAVHAIISTNVGFDSAQDIIELANIQGAYKGVKIGNQAFLEAGPFTGIVTESETLLPEEESLYDGFPVQKVYRCKKTGWSYAQLLNGKYFGIAGMDSEVGDQDQVIKFLQKNFTE